MKVLIYEPSFTGHRLQYVRIMINALVKLADEVVFVTSNDVPESAQYKTHIQDLEGIFTLDASISRNSGNLVGHAINSVRSFLLAIKQHKPVHVYVPYADGFAQILGLFRFMGLAKIDKNMRLEILIMRAEYFPNTEGWKTKIKNWFWFKMIDCSGAEIVHFLNSVVYENIKLSNILRRSSPALMSEPVEHMEVIDINTARSDLDIPVNGRYISCFGALDKRKGIDLLLHAFSSANLNENDRLLLMGPVSLEVRQIIDSKYASLLGDGRLILVDRYITQDELVAGLCASNLVCTPYPEHLGSSGIVVRAATIGKPVLAANVGWMSYVVPKFNLGYNCDVQNKEIFRLSIEKHLEECSGYLSSAETISFNRFQSCENFANSWVFLLKNTNKIGL